MREAIIHAPDSAFEAIGMGEFITLCRSAGLKQVTEVSCEGSSGVVLIEVDQQLDESTLTELEYVEHWDRVSEAEASYLYLIALTSPGLSESLDDVADELVPSGSGSVSDYGFTMSLVGSHDAIREMLTEYEDSGMTLELERVGDFSGSPDPLESLTERQREILDTAYEMGYYQVPRGVSTKDVAEIVDLDPSTVAEHLQRAERNLLDSVLSKPSNRFT